jgi:predicted PurR-regulated permease PerM
MLSFRKDRHDREMAVTISTGTFVRLAILSIFTLVLVMAIQKASHALLLLFTAFFMTLALNAPVHWISEQLPGKKRGDRVLATTISFLFVVLLIGGFIASISPPLVRQTQGFIHNAPQLVRDFRSQNSPTGRFIRDHHLENQIDSVSNQLSERLKHVGGTAFSTVQKVGTSVFAILTIFVLTFMMLIEGPRWIAFTRDLIPDRHHKRADRLAVEMYDVVKGFVNGQVTLAALAAVLIMPPVLALHISYPVALMVVIFVCGLIPLVGHTIGAIIVTTVALFHSIGAAIFILAYYILYQQLENIFIQPKIQANSTNMSPLLVFASLLVGVSFGGLFGGLVAIPVAGCVRKRLSNRALSKKLLPKPNRSSWRVAQADTFVFKHSPYPV